MTDPRIVTDADTVARLAEKARAIDKILGDDRIVMITIGDIPIGGIAARNDDDGSWVAVAIEGGDVWHYDGTDTVQAPKAAPDPDTVHPGGDRCNDDMGGKHFIGGHCVCLGECCNTEGPEGACVCRWGCTVEDHGH